MNEILSQTDSLVDCNQSFCCTVVVAVIVIVKNEEKKTKLEKAEFSR